MTNKLVQRLWNDDAGALIAIEFLFVATILIIGIIVGLANVRDAVNIELTELGNAILALSQGFTIGGAIGCCASTDGSQAIDIPGLLPAPICVPPAIPSVISVEPLCIN
jgi:Flp pilus assembly pilin Flp